MRVAARRLLWAGVLSRWTLSCQAVLDLGDDARPDAGVDAESAATDAAQAAVDAKQADGALDAGSTSGPGTIACGATRCTASQGCCLADDGGGTCVAPQVSACGGLLLACDDGADCQAGYVCCADYDQTKQRFISPVSCRKTEACVNLSQLARFCEVPLKPTNPDECVIAPTVGYEAATCRSITSDSRVGAYGECKF